MANERSLFSAVAEELKEEIRQARLGSGVADSIPFGMQRVPRQQFVRSIRKMTPEQRKAWLGLVGGGERAMAMLEGRNAS